MEQSQSLVFDRAVDYYDRTRGLSRATMAHIVRILSGEVVGRGLCLEIGIGTGRIALPLAQAGAELVGADLSRPMLQKLIEKKPAALRIPVVQADATTLPFAAGSFGGAVAVHVLHLIPQWKKAAGELIRVVGSGGAILIDLGGRHGVGEEIKEHFCYQASLSPRHRGLNDAAEIDDFMASSGLAVRELEPVIETKELTYEDVIARLESGIFSLTWESSEEGRQRAGEATRAWARDRFGPLDQTYSHETTVAYRAYDVP